MLGPESLLYVIGINQDAFVDYRLFFSATDGPTCFVMI